MPIGTFAESASRPNMIFILADDLGYGELGCFGQQIIQTPHLDRMAAEGLRFSQFYAGSTVCAPARSVLMTGQHTGRTRVRGNDRVPLRPEDLTVAELLKEAGYSTALIGKWGLGEEGATGVPNRQGFDYFFGYLNQRHAHNYYPAFLYRNEDRVPLKNVVPGEGLYGQNWATEKQEYSHDLFIDETLEWIERVKEEPFFLYLALTIPHANNEGFRGTGDGQEIPDYGIYQEKPWSNPHKGQAAMITRMDADIGRMLQHLKELGLDERTLVIFSSDNGPHREGGNDPEFFGASGPLRGLKRDLYEGGIRVPTIARWPGKIAPGTISHHLAYFGDWMATAAELAAISAPSDLDSISFVPTLLGELEKQEQHRFLYWEFYEMGSAQAVRQGPWKAIRLPMHTGEIELYNLKNDPGESANLAADHPQIAAQLAAIMDQAHTPDPLWKPRGKRPPQPPKPGHGRMPF